MSTITKPLPGTKRDPLYPDSDGQPMGETGFHVIALLYVYNALHEYFAGREDIYVAGDMFLYYEKGNPRACKGPDVMFIRGVSGNHERRSFRTWEEGVAPTVIFEMTSSESQTEDQIAKPRVYAELGVAEYFVFDPEGEYLEPRLQGFRLTRGRYVPIRPDTEGRLVSQELEMAVVAERYLPRLIELKSGKPILTWVENAADAREARRLADLAIQEAADAKKKAAAEERKAVKAQRRAEAQREQAEALRQQAEAEKKQAEAAQRRVEELEAQLQRLRRSQKSGDD